MAARIVAVTGAAGSLGPTIGRFLHEAGWSIRALEHRRPVPWADESCSGDVLDIESLRQAFQGVHGVLHLAAVTHARRAEDYRRINVRGTALVLEAAHETEVEQLVHVSTRAISPSGGPYSESKYQAEELVGLTPVPASIVRLPEIYGAGSAEGVDEIIDRARARRPIPVVGGGLDEICPVHVDDAASALVAALERGHSGKTYTLAGQCMTVRNFAEHCVSAAGGGGRIVGIPTVAARAAAALSRIVPLPVYPDQLARLQARKPRDASAARTDLGFTSRPLREGLHDLV